MKIAPALTRVPIDSIQPHPRNARQGDIGALTLSLQRFGQVRPIVVQASTSLIVAGNHLWRAAKSLGWTEIGAVAVEMTDDQALAYLVADNRLADLGSYDDSGLAELLSEIAGSGSLVGTGYDEDDVDDLLRLVSDPPGLDQLGEKYGDEDEESSTFWPVIHIKVEHSVHARWQRLWSTLEGSDSERLSALLGRLEDS